MLPFLAGSQQLFFQLISFFSFLKTITRLSFSAKQEDGDFVHYIVSFLGNLFKTCCFMKLFRLLQGSPATLSRGGGRGSYLPFVATRPYTERSPLELPLLLVFCYQHALFKGLFMPLPGSRCCRFSRSSAHHRKRGFI